MLGVAFAKTWILLLAAFVLSDSVLALLMKMFAISRNEQPDAMLRALLTAGFGYALVGDWLWWDGALAVLLWCGVIGLMSRKMTLNAGNFVLQHLLRAGGFSLVALYIPPGSFGWTGELNRVVVVLAGWALSVGLASRFISLFVEPLLEQMEQPQKGLERGGEYIGQLERTLIYIFVLVGQPAAVGFLVAAKSLRALPEIKNGDTRFSEYVLIGTLLSFTLGVAIAYGAKLGLQYVM